MNKSTHYNMICLAVFIVALMLIISDIMPDIEESIVVEDGAGGIRYTQLLYYLFALLIGIPIKLYYMFKSLINNNFIIIIAISVELIFIYLLYKTFLWNKNREQGTFYKYLFSITSILYWVITSYMNVMLYLL